MLFIILQINVKGLRTYGNEIIGGNGLIVEDILRGIQRLEFTNMNFMKDFMGRRKINTTFS